MTLQEILDQNYQWFIVDRNAPGFDISRGRCVYNGTPVDGKPCRCAIGCCLPDDLLEIAEEIGGDIDTLMGDEDDLDADQEAICDFFGDKNRMALLKLQRAHDAAAKFSATFHDDYKIKLKNWAQEFGLKLPDGLS